MVATLMSATTPSTRPVPVRWGAGRSVAAEGACCYGGELRAVGVATASSRLSTTSLGITTGPGAEGPRLYTDCESPRSHRGIMAECARPAPMPRGAREARAAGALRPPRGSRRGPRAALQSAANSGSSVSVGSTVATNIYDVAMLLGDARPNAPRDRPAPILKDPGCGRGFASWPVSSRRARRHIGDGGGLGSAAEHR